MTRPQVFSNSDAHFTQALALGAEAEAYALPWLKQKAKRHSLSFLDNRAAHEAADGYFHSRSVAEMPIEIKRTGATASRFPTVILELETPKGLPSWAFKNDYLLNVKEPDGLAKSYWVDLKCLRVLTDNFQVWEHGAIRSQRFDGGCLLAYVQIDYLKRHGLIEEVTEQVEQAYTAHYGDQAPEHLLDPSLQALISSPLVRPKQQKAA